MTYFNEDIYEVIKGTKFPLLLGKVFDKIDKILRDKDKERGVR